VPEHHQQYIQQCPLPKMQERDKPMGYTSSTLYRGRTW